MASQNLPRIGNRCFLVVLCDLMGKRPKLEVATKEASPSAGKNVVVVLVLLLMHLCPCSYIKDLSEAPCISASK